MRKILKSNSFSIIMIFILLDWDKEHISETPPTKHISIQDLNNIATGEKNLKDFIPKVMSHSIGKIHAFK